MSTSTRKSDTKVSPALALGLLQEDVRLLQQSGVDVRLLSKRLKSGHPVLFVVIVGAQLRDGDFVLEDKEGQV